MILYKVKGRNTIPLEISAISAMQYALWKTVIMGGRIVGYDTSADLNIKGNKNNGKAFLKVHYLVCCII